MLDVTPAEFIAFARENYPDIYDAIAALYMKKPVGLGADSGAGNSWSDLSQQSASFLADLANGILDFQRKQELQRINIERAQRGLGPLGDDFRPIDTGERIMTGITGSTDGSMNALLLVGAVGLIAFWFGRK